MVDGSPKRLNKAKRPLKLSAGYIMRLVSIFDISQASKRKLTISTEAGPKVEEAVMLMLSLVGSILTLEAPWTVPAEKVSLGW